MVWLRLVDPECKDIPRPGYNSADPEQTELDISHTQRCPQCMSWLMEQKEIEEPN